LRYRPASRGGKRTIGDPIRAIETNDGICCFACYGLSALTKRYYTRCWRTSLNSVPRVLSQTRSKAIPNTALVLLLYLKNETPQAMSRLPMLLLLFVLSMHASITLAQTIFPYPPTERFCAVFDPSVAGGASGTFTMLVTPSLGQSQFSFSIDLSSFSNPSTCDLSKGLAFHIHSYWSDFHASAFGTACGTLTNGAGGHYDPYLACSPDSQAQVDNDTHTHTHTHAFTYAHFSHTHTN